MPSPSTGSSELATVLREQREYGRDVKRDCIGKDLRLADIAAELGIHETAFSAVINGRRVWQSGLDDLKTKVADAIARLAVAA